MSGVSRLAGTALSGNDHLAQSIGDILTTPIGSRIMRRDYGSMLFELIDQPLNPFTRLLVFASSALALRRWEPRLRLKRIQLAAPAETPGAATLLIEGERTDLSPATTRVTLSIPIRAGGVVPQPAAV